MSKDSPLVACSIAASILLVAGAAVVPSSAWRAASVLARVAPALVTTAGLHGTTAARAASLGVLSAPGLLRDAPAAAPERKEHRLCRRDVPRTCDRQAECPRQLFQRLHLVFPIRG
ncbi:MAG TPA: hypothetical protein VLQ79_00220 [Myxococcaceae bacterium]|nr:hypothetical protein [Myxococcaceae bacterium]